MGEEGIRSHFSELLCGVLDDEKLSKKIEREIYNWSLNYAEKNSITRRWDNVNFKSIYTNKCISIINNIDKESYVCNDNLQKKVVGGEVSAE